MTTPDPYDQYLAAVEDAASTASDLQSYLSMLSDIEADAIADPGRYSDTLDLELVLTVTSVAAESATYADTEVEIVEGLHHDRLELGAGRGQVGDAAGDRAAGLAAVH